MSDIIYTPSVEANALKPGIYRHFKGNEYELILVARNSENRNEELVVYKSLKYNNFWARPLKMFLENVDRDGYSGPRFVWVREK